MKKHEELAAIIEGILFVAGEAVEIETLTQKLTAKPVDIKKAVELLKCKFDANSGINIVEFNKKLQFASNSTFAEQIAIVLNPIKEKALTKATLETMSIIAYKQPITRLEIEQIRGVSSDYAVDLLLQNNLIEVIGRKDTIGKPLLYATTEQFLKRFEIGSLDDLPDYEEVLSKLKTIKDSEYEEQVQKTLFSEVEIATGEDKEA